MQRFIEITGDEREYFFGMAWKYCEPVYVEGYMWHKHETNTGLTIYTDPQERAKENFHLRKFYKLVSLPDPEDDLDDDYLNDLNFDTKEKDMLYTWKDDNGNDLFGTLLATNSNGDFVMEVKGAGSVIAVATDKVEVVHPYTVSVRFVGGNMGEEYSCLAPKDKYKVGDLLVVNAPSGPALVFVGEVDTKSSHATKDLPVIGKVSVDTSVVN